MADVFISYHEKSAGELAAQIARTLESGGISCWYAKRDISPGGDFAKNIPAQIDSCSLFLIIFNQHVYQSKHIENELGLAFSRFNRGTGIIILPLELKDFRREDWAEYYLIHTQSVKMPVPDTKNMQKLARQVAKLLKRKWKPRSEPSEPPEKPAHSKAPQKPAQPKAPDLTTVVESGAIGDCTWTLNYDGLLRISGDGNMDRNRYGDSWTSSPEYIQSVIIEDGVTSIGAWAFYHFWSLTSVRIPDSVTRIGDGAFRWCPSLTSVRIPNRVTRIGDKAFSFCISLTSVRIPDSVKFIGKYAFRCCNCLTSVSIPAKARIGLWAFDQHTEIRRRWF